MSHCVYIGIIVMCKNFIKNPRHILWILYFAQEVRSGCEEVYEFFKIKNKWTTVNKEIANFITEYLSDIKHNIQFLIEY